MPAPPPPAGSVPHKMTVKAGEGEAAERKRRLKLLLPHLWCCLLRCAAQQWQKCLAGASSNNDASVHAFSPLAGVLGNQISSSATLSSSLTNKSKKKLVSNNNKCQTHDDLFCLLCFSSPQKIWDYSTHGIRAVVEVATSLWMAVKFFLFRAGKNRLCKNVGWKGVHSPV